MKMLKIVNILTNKVLKVKGVKFKLAITPIFYSWCGDFYIIKKIEYSF